MPFYNVASSVWRSALSFAQYVGKGCAGGLCSCDPGTSSSGKGRESSLCIVKNDALCLAAANGHLQCVEPLLAMSAELSPLPFIFPITHYKLAMLELLLVGGAAPGTLNREYLTAFEYALNNNHKICAKPLFEKSTYVELQKSPGIAANMGRLCTVRVLLEKDVGVGTRLIDSKNPAACGGML